MLANRLSANGRHTVCLLEAGGNTRHPFVQIPAGWGATFGNSTFDWGYSTEPEPALNNRSVYWPRGLGLGGSSAINGMIYIRGHAVDFERWVQAGAEGWGYDDVLPYFRRAERQQHIDNEFHGHEGPLHVQDPRDKRSVHEAFIEGMVESAFAILILMVPIRRVQAIISSPNKTAVVGVPLMPISGRRDQGGI